ncbi:MAG: helix-turn-helix domain-containing protein [Candidatus Liptonbacteria bacterium]|nr:helix-turn-helix domain-containing protein [Candidatus Liptonbacteria bacterium]
MEPEDREEFEVFFKERLKEHGLSLKKLSEITAISERHLANLAGGRYEDLPAAPYLRGYLIRIGQVLGFQGEEWWERLRAEGVLKGAGPEDELPHNRFRAGAPPRVFLFTIAVAILAVAYFGVRARDIFGTPLLAVTAPDAPITNTASSTVRIAGILAGGDRITINGEVTELRAGGAWQKEVTLAPGLNTFEIRASKFLGREARVMRQIFYEPQATSTLERTEYLE